MKEEEIRNNESTSKKNDFKDNKLRWDLLPLETIENLVKVYSFGSKKYSDNSWQNLDNFWERYKAALLRHLTAIEKGEFYDKESGLPHSSHLMWNAVALDYGFTHGKGKVVYKDIPGYEEFYYADSNGNIYSKDRFHNTSQGGFIKKGRMLKPFKNNRGYLNVSLCGNNGQKTEKVHRLIAKTFLDNPNNYQEINHKNEIKDDNRVINLEWCDRLYNMNYGTIRSRLSEHADSKNRVKPIVRLNKNGDVIRKYESITSVKEDGFDPSYVLKVCRGTKQEAYGFVWKYDDLSDNSLLEKLNKRIEEKINNCNKILDELETTQK